jgi:tripeptide aminopeptidase
MDLGRLDEGTTANVGLIRGGTSGNVVAGHCFIHAEARSLELERAAEVAGRIADACAWGASEHDCDVDVRIEELFRGYQVPKESPALALAEDGLRGAGLEPRRVGIGGGSDANVFRREGFDSVLLANGTDAVHTEHEMVPARNLDKMLEVCEGIVAAVAVGGVPEPAG